MGAMSLYVRQQYERVWFGGPEERDEVLDDNASVTKQLLTVLEQALDEDLLAKLDDLDDLQHPPWMVGAGYPFPFFAAGGGPWWPDRREPRSHPERQRAQAEAD